MLPPIQPIHECRIKARGTLSGVLLWTGVLGSSVADPYHFDTDPGKNNTDPDSDPDKKGIGTRKILKFDKKLISHALCAYTHYLPITFLYQTIKIRL